MDEIILINNQKLPVKEYDGQRVVTFKDIDTIHNRPEGTASRNFKTNRNHFIEGEDFYIVKHSDIQKDEIRTLGFEVPNRGITLITESGYLMLVKSFTDNLAWDVQRDLVNKYFRIKVIDKCGRLIIAEYEKRLQELERKMFDLYKELTDYKTNYNNVQKKLLKYYKPQYDDTGILTVHNLQEFLKSRNISVKYNDETREIEYKRIYEDNPSLLDEIAHDFLIPNNIGMVIFNDLQNDLKRCSVGKIYRFLDLIAVLKHDDFE